MRAKEFTSQVNQDVAEGTEQFCEVCGGSLAESGKASRKLCKSTKPNSELGASQLSRQLKRNLLSIVNVKRSKVKKLRVATTVGHCQCGRGINNEIQRVSCS